MPKSGSLDAVTKLVFRSAVLIALVLILYSSSQRAGALESRITETNWRLRELVDDVEQLGVRLTRAEARLSAQRATDDEPDIRSGTTEKTSEPVATTITSTDPVDASNESVLEPPHYPFLTEETLPEEYRGKFGDNEIFMALGGGRIARMTIPGSDADLHADLATRTAAEDFLAIEVARREMAQAYAYDRILEGKATLFDSDESARAFIDERYAAGDVSEGSNRFSVTPFEDRFAVVDLGPLHESDAYRGMQDDVFALADAIGIPGATVFFYEPGLFESRAEADREAAERAAPR